MWQFNSFARCVVYIIINKHIYTMSSSKQASKSARIYPDYAWILYGWYSEEWWKSTNVNCTEEELASVLERALVIQQYPINDNMSTELVSSVENLCFSEFSIMH